MHKPRFESLVNGPMRRDLEKRLPNETRLQTSLTSLSPIYLVFGHTTWGLCIMVKPPYM